MSTDHRDYGGLHEDLQLTQAAIRRRDMLRMALGAGALQLLGCGDSITGSEADDSACAVIPEETAGPYPGDGSNGPNVLNQAGVVRGDIRSSFAGLNGTASGVPLVVTLKLVSLQAGCAPAPGLAVYLWHCDREGRYSLYSSGVTSQNYLRGVQESDANGELSFTTIFPGCYAGRWPHIHFEVYPSLSAAASVSNKVATSQLAFPAAVCSAAYAVAGYETSVSNLAGVSLATDNVFSDGATRQTATMTGDTTAGFTASLTVAV